MRIFWFLKYPAKPLKHMFADIFGGMLNIRWVLYHLPRPGRVSGLSRVALGILAYLTVFDFASTYAQEDDAGERLLEEQRRQKQLEELERNRLICSSPCSTSRS